MGDTDQGWEYAAAEWIDFIHSGDKLHDYNFSRFLSNLPAPSGLTIDVGCGEGRIARELKASGYAVTGVDPSPTLIGLAREGDPTGDYHVATASALPIDEGEAALVVSFMTLEHVADLQGACNEARRVLANGGSFCFSLIHPTRSGGGFEGTDEQAKFVLDDYFSARDIDRSLYEKRVVAHHRPLSEYSAALSNAGFVILRIDELSSKRRAAGRLPMFMHIVASVAG